MTALYCVLFKDVYQPPFVASSDEEAKMLLIRSIEERMRSGDGISPVTFLFSHLTKVALVDFSPKSGEDVITSIKPVVVGSFFAIWDQFHQDSKSLLSNMVVDLNSLISSVDDLPRSEEELQEALKASQEAQI